MGRTKETENSLGFSEYSDIARPVSIGKRNASAERESFSKLPVPLKTRPRLQLQTSNFRHPLLKTRYHIYRVSKFFKNLSDANNTV